MDVTLPNGTVIKGVPEGTSKEEIKAKAISAGLAQESDFPAVEQPESPPTETTVADQPAETEDSDAPLSVLQKYSEKIRGLLTTGTDVATTVVGNLITSPLPGLAGIADNFRPSKQYMQDPRAAIQSGNMVHETTPNERAQTVSAIRDMVTFEPSTKGGREAMQKVGEFVQPLAEGMENASNQMGEHYRDLTGSDKVGAVASAIPAAVAEAIPLLAATKGARVAGGVKRVPMERKITKSINEAAPDQTTLRANADNLFQEIDDMGVTINRDSFAELVAKAEESAKSKGGSPRVTTEAWGALDDMKETLKKIDEGQPIPLSELEELREIASVAADTPGQAKKQAVALAIVNEIDDFIDNASPRQFNMPEGANSNAVGVKYKQARENWGRYRKSQMLDKAVSKAELQASGFENGIRIQFRQILNSEKRSRYFNDSELAAMKSVVDGTAGANILKALGKAGIDFGGGNNALLAMLTGMGTYGVTDNALWAFGVVGASSAAKKLAERLTVSNAALANQVVRAGKDARKITEAYLRNTPKAQRSADELSLLLMDKNIDLSVLGKQKLLEDAAKLATERRLQLTGALATGEASSKDGQLLLQSQ